MIGTRVRRAALALGLLGTAGLGLTATASPASAAVATKAYHDDLSGNGATGYQDATFQSDGSYIFYGKANAKPYQMTNVVCRYYVKDGSYIWSIYYKQADANGVSTWYEQGNSSLVSTYFSRLYGSRCYLTASDPA